MGKVIVDASNGAMFQRRQKVGFTFKVADHDLLNRRILCLNDHLLDGHYLCDIWEMKIPRPVDCTHATRADDALDLVPVCKVDPGLQAL